MLVHVESGIYDTLDNHWEFIDKNLERINEPILILPGSIDKIEKGVIKKLYPPFKVTEIVDFEYIIDCKMVEFIYNE